MMTPLDPRIHQALDGEIPRDTLPLELQREVDRLERAAAVLRAAVAAPTVADRLMADVRRTTPPPPLPPRPRRLTALGRAGRWLTTPWHVTIRLRPVWTLALVAALALVAVLPTSTGGPVLAGHEGIAHFVGHFPGAKSVDVAGSFNDWRPGAIQLHDEDRDGVWRASVVLPAGQHEYMFVVDGERWIADPLAGRYVDDGFGRENAFLIVRPAGGP